ncbi:MAG TPA: acyl-CoA reductase [Streptosporangiaceae bacterium]
MSLAARFPATGPTGIDALLAELAAVPAGGPLTVGDERVIDFLSGVSKRLLDPAVTRRHPELGPLGFFLRRAELLRALPAPADGRRQPRGLIFHVPPANVDTIFAYSWALAALTGNHNVVRLSARAAGAAEAVLAALNEALAGAHPAIGQTQRIVTYGHDAEVTERLSAACDLRVIWGGDRAVNDVRRHPIRPLARDLTFPDRASFAAVSVPGWAAADHDARRAAAAAFAADAYWFDQAACASPRAVYWIGPDLAAARARAEFDALLAAAVRDRGWAIEPAMAVQNRVGAYGAAADGTATAIGFVSDMVTTLDLAVPAAYPRARLGTGVFAHATLARLTDLAGVVDRRDQTLTYFGFSAEELRDLATALAGRGIDRIVPFGAALSFSPVWDGYDLPREFTKIMTIR